MYGRPISEIIEPNAEDADGDYWDPWQALGLMCCSYNAEVDQNAIDVLRGIQEKLYNSDIAERTGLSPEHVELLQGIFCSADWCEYGTSPRGCWPIDREGFHALIAAWEAYYLRHWEEAPAIVDTRRMAETGTGSGRSPSGDGARSAIAQPSPDGHPHE